MFPVMCETNDDEDEDEEDDDVESQRASQVAAQVDDCFDINKAVKKYSC